MLFKTTTLFILLVFLTIYSLNLITASSATPVSGQTSKSVSPQADNTKIETFKDRAVDTGTFGSPSAESWRRCETSGASPTTQDIYGVVQALHQRGGTCCNTAIRRNECTNIIAFGGADIGFCGIQRCIPCSQMGAEVWWVALDCQRDGKAGGVAFLDDTSYITVY